MTSTENPHLMLHDLLAKSTNVDTLTTLAEKSTNETTRRVAQARLDELMDEANAVEDMLDGGWMDAPEFPQGSVTDF